MSRVTRHCEAQSYLGLGWGSEGQGFAQGFRVETTLKCLSKAKHSTTGVAPSC
jgi:hypothetical protein